MNRLATLFPILSCIICLLFLLQQPLYAEEQKKPAATPDYSVLDGKWQRTDGNYSIKVSEATAAEGRVQAEYFNPKPIQISQSTVSTQEGLIRLFIKFQDQNYEGSTYTLYYYAEKDALAGFYYHAVLDRTYKVIFLRKES